MAFCGSARPLCVIVVDAERYSEDDLAWIGLITCLRDADLGIADLRRFTELLRAEGAGDRVAFLRRRREELLDRVRRTQAAIKVLDDKISYYSP